MRIYTYTCVSHTHVYRNVYVVHVRLFIHACMHAHVCTPMCACHWMRTITCMHAHMRSHMRPNADTHSHAYMHGYMHAQSYEQCMGGAYACGNVLHENHIHSDPTRVWNHKLPQQRRAHEHLAIQPTTLVLEGRMTSPRQPLSRLIEQTHQHT